MQYQDYQHAVQQAAQLADQGDYAGAIQAFQRLLASDVSDLDKAMMCLNIALICGKMGQEEEALAWYNRGISYERPYYRYQLAERMAVYLAERGRYQESLAMYRALLAERSLTEHEKERIRNNIALLQRNC
ncbi:MAG: hypothetical protein KatS3mg057_2936 [Herpetosiphonaceae bacterium]|nr:MAG: hypothetical protein KatS3mg057_2936 [Herpetosiphonaceae bacterium]